MLGKQTAPFYSELRSVRLEGQFCISSIFDASTKTQPQKCAVMEGRFELNHDISLPCLFNSVRSPLLMKYSTDHDEHAVELIREGDFPTLF